MKKCKYSIYRLSSNDKWTRFGIRPPPPRDKIWDTFLKKMEQRRRRFSAAPARQNQIRSGETYVRVFANAPLGLAVLENHRVGAVAKHAQGDYAGVQVGDTILEVDQRRVRFAAVLRPRALSSFLFSFLLSPYFPSLIQ